MKKLSYALACITAVSAFGLTAPAVAAEETVKIGFIDPLSGLMGPVGNDLLRNWQFGAQVANAEGWAKGVKFEIVPFDNKLSPQESLTLLQTAVDQGIHYVVQGMGSSVGIPLQQAVQRNNDRNPGHPVLYINQAAVDPVQTNDNCTFSHVRLDGHVDMKVSGIVKYITENNPDTRKVYLINQDYSFGHSVAKAAKEQLKKANPDIEIVGEDLHPLARVTDFSQYAAKIRSSGADTIITGNWGSDLGLLVKAARDAGVTAKFYTFYGDNTGAPTLIGEAGVGRVYRIAAFDWNNAATQKAIEAYKQKHNGDFWNAVGWNGIKLLAEAINKAGSTEPLKVAAAMEGLSVDGLNGQLTVRAEDHQLQQPFVMASWQKVDGDKVKIDQEKTGHGWRAERTFKAEELALPSTCKMKRPS